MEVLASLPEQAQPQLLSNLESSEFAAAVCRVAVVDGVAFINPDAARALGLASGGQVQVVGLQQKESAA